MILKVLIEGFLGLASFLLHNTFSILGISEINNTLLEAFNVFTSFLTMSSQFCYFMLGNYLFIILPLLIPLIAFKYVVYPIISFARGFIRWGN